VNVDQIRDILNQEDIEGLLRLGAPNDEYETEAKMIAEALAEQKELADEDRLSALVRVVWIKAFSPFSEAALSKRAPAFSRVAKNLKALSES
jgi:hypothetical protein